VGDAETYAEFGIPGPAPCPLWCQGKYGGSHAGPSGAVIFHGASAIGGGVLVDDHAVTLGMNWVERFDGGAWQPLRAEDVTVFLQVGMDYIAVDATARNMAGQLLKETRDARQAGQDAGR
jgi:hypothetical protein